MPRLSDTEIADHVLRNNLSFEDESDDECNVVETSSPIGHATAMDMLGKCLEWVEHQPEATSSYNTSILVFLKAGSSEETI